MIGTVGTRILGEDVEQRPDDPGGARAAATVPADGRCRRRGLRDGGLQPCPGDGPGRRHRLRRGGLPQPRPRPSRLPPRHGRLLRGQGPAVHARARRVAGWSTSTTPGVERLARAGPGPGPDPVRRRPRRRLAWRGRRARRRPARGSGSPDRTASTSRPAARSPAGSTSPTPWPRSPPRPPPATTRSAVAGAIAEGPGVPGRLERIDEGQDFAVVVDYAHKPDAVAAALATLRPVTAGRLIVVLGAGGDRDPGKRPVMGEIAARERRRPGRHRRQPAQRGPRGDPRGDPGRDDRGGTAEVVEIGDRRAAIAEAIRRAGAGDVVLIAGKGHESGQEVAGVVHPVRRPRGGPRGAAPVIAAQPGQDRGRGRRPPRRCR